VGDLNSWKTAPDEISDNGRLFLQSLFALLGWIVNAIVLVINGRKQIDRIGSQATWKEQRQLAMEGDTEGTV